MNVPIKNCNLSCHYCYISALKQIEKGKAEFKFSPEYVGKCMSIDRLGGVCIINLTGGGETLIPHEMPQYIECLLKEGHYLEIVTNGTLSKRFDEIAVIDAELLKRLEFKFSFHYIELKKKKLLDVFISNVNKVKAAGCSFTIEVTPTDELIPYIDELKEICLKNFGALCQMTIARNDLTGSKEVLSKQTIEEYYETWEQFDSTMFAFKKNIFRRKCTEFCYAGEWSLYVDLGTGMSKPCYGQMYNQNIFEDQNKPIKFLPVGKHCRMPYCYNGHAFLTCGDIPELKTPTYSEIRNRKCEDGSEWEYPELKEAFSAKLVEANIEWNNLKKTIHEILFPLRFVSNAIYDHSEIKKKLSEQLKKENGK